jgi:Kef-type K+ transport system membrane component KefB
MFRRDLQLSVVLFVGVLMPIWSLSPTLGAFLR